MLEYILVSTPMCGTCDVAKKMNSVLSEIFKDTIVYKELNFIDNQEFVTAYQIESTPAFLIFKNGELQEKFYAFHSVKFLYDKLNSYF